MPTVVHLTASTLYGGPERQMCELARILPRHYRSVFVSFAEGSRCQAFLDEMRKHGFEAVALRHDTPHIRAAVRELAGYLRRFEANVLCCHGYKADLLGRPAARRERIPVVAVSRGWTGASFKIRIYEVLDRISLRRMDRVVCVSEGQATKVRRAGVPGSKVAVIHNAVRADRFACADPAFRGRLQAFFPSPRSRIIGAAGRLSPEKGFQVLVEAAATVTRADPSLGFILFGDGPLRETLARQVASAGLAGRFILAGFRSDLDDFLPHFDLLVLPSYTEGLPNVVLEASAAAVPVVATAVGGTPEVVEHGVTGFLVPPGKPAELAGRIRDVLATETRAREMGLRGQERTRRHFSFSAQGERYQHFFESLLAVREPVRVCFMIDELSSAGTESQLIALIRELDRSRIAPHLCLLRGDKSSSRALEPPSCPVIRLGVSSLHHPSTLWKALRLARFFRRHRIDVLQVYFQDSTYLGVPVARLAGVPRVVRTRNNLGYWMTPVHRWLGRLCNRGVDVLATNCEACRQAVIADEGIDPGRVVVLENGVDLSRFPEPHTRRQPEAGRRIGIVANLRPVKNVDLFVRAAAQVAARHPNVTFHLAGEGEQRPALEKLAVELELAGRLFLHGSLADIPGFVAGLDIAVLCSRSEGMSNALLEYMAAGKAIVATDVGANGQLIEHEIHGLLVLPGDSESLAGAMLRLLGDEALAARLGSAARHRARSQYSREAMIRRFEAFYEQLARREL
jgi:glycosyltransferase involved in cell wall biosynthesis